MTRVSIEKKEDGYVFSAYPANNNQQALGVSANVYQNIAQAREARKSFISLVRTHNLQKEDGRLVLIEEHNKKFFFKYLDENGICIFQRTIGYEQRINCENGIRAVFEAVNNT